MREAIWSCLGYIVRRGVSRRGLLAWMLCLLHWGCGPSNNGTESADAQGGLDDAESDPAIDGPAHGDVISGLDEGGGDTPADTLDDAPADVDADGGTDVSVDAPLVRLSILTPLSGTVLSTDTLDLRVEVLSVSDTIEDFDVELRASGRVLDTATGVRDGVIMLSGVLPRTGAPSQAATVDVVATGDNGELGSAHTSLPTTIRGALRHR